MNTLTLEQKKIQMVEMADLFTTCELAIFFSSNPSVAIRRACKHMYKRFQIEKMQHYAKTIYSASNPLIEYEKRWVEFERNAAEIGVTVDDYLKYGAELDAELRRNSVREYQQ